MCCLWLSLDVGTFVLNGCSFSSTLILLADWPIFDMHHFNIHSYNILSVCCKYNVTSRVTCIVNLMFSESIFSFL